MAEILPGRSSVGTSFGSPPGREDVIFDGRGGQTHVRSNPLLLSQPYVSPASDTVIYAGQRFGKFRVVVSLSTHN